MDARYQPCPFCDQIVDMNFVRKMKSFRKILPKIVLTATDEEPVDPCPALITSEELIKICVEQAITGARKRHFAGSISAPATD